MTLLVETIVREDAIALYGFLGTAERDWFRILTTVQGVGAKVALSILSTLSPDEIAAPSRHTTSATLEPPAGRRAEARRAPRHRAQGQGRPPLAWRPCGKGVGPRAAGRLVNEDAVSALVNLGYKRVEAFAAVARVTQRLGADGEARPLITAGLQELAR